MQRQKIFLFILFFSILIFFVIPPIVVPFFTPHQNSFVAHYPLSVFLNGGIAFLIYYFSQVKPKIFENPPFLREKQPLFACLFSYSSNALVCFGVLCLSSVIYEAISFLSGSDSGIHTIMFPSDFLGFVNFFCGVIFAAFFEEVVYRFFLPSAFRELFCKERKVKNQILSLFYEGISVILFALAHLYLGVFGFLNALFCGIALRVCMVRTKSISVTLTVHSLYNFLTITLYSILS